ncbi:methylmalonyl-CoA epimerase [Cladochytrium replicatum]|nr:methylmalonyl-CoA epimerase [Cladochytrium replicatum]
MSSISTASSLETRCAQPCCNCSAGSRQGVIVLPASDECASQCVCASSRTRRYTVFVSLGNTKIELLHPLGDKSPISNFLKKNPSGGIHHICIEVDNINEALKDLVGKGIRSLDPVPKTGAHGNRSCFFIQRTAGCPG